MASASSRGSPSPRSASRRSPGLPSGSSTRRDGSVGAERRAPRLVLIAGVAAVVVAVDQLTKWWALQALDDRTIDLFWTLRLNLVFNTGAAFGRFDGLGPLIGIIVVVVIGAIVYTGRRAVSTTSAIALGMVLGGALGNFLDRLFRDGDGFLGGPVVDFVDLQWWPVFNVADASIVLGVLVLGAFGFRDLTEEQTAAS